MMAPRNGDDRHHDHRPKAPGLDPARIRALLSNPDLRLNDTPALAAMAYHLLRQPDQTIIEPDRALAAIFQEEIETRLLFAQTCGDPFLGNYPPRGALSTATGEIPLLTLPTGDALSLPATRLMNNVIIAGPTRSGKSTLQRNMLTELVRCGFGVVYFDRKDEARQLLAQQALQGLVTVLRLQDLKISLYQSDNGIPPDSVRASTTDLIGRWTGRVFAQRLLDEPVEACLAAGENGKGIPLKLLIEKVRHWPVRGFRETDLRESILRALSYINAHLGSVFDYQWSDCLKHLFQRPHLFVVEVRALPADLYGLIIRLIIEWLALQRLHVPRPDPLPVVFVLDDATVAVDMEMDRQAVTGTSPLAEQLFMNGKLGMGMLITTHSLSKISHKILSNSETLIMTAARGEDARFLQNSIGLTAAQVEVLRVLQPGQAMAMVPSKWPRPVLGTFRQEATAIVDEAACRASAAAFLAGVSSEKPAMPPVGISGMPSSPPAPQVSPAPSSSSSAQLTDQQLRILLHCFVPLPPALTELYQRENLSRARGSDLMRRLETAGLIQLHRFSTGRPGGQLTMPGLTDAGWGVLIQRGLIAARPAPPTKGGTEHNWAAAALEVVGAREGYRTDFEVDLGTVRVDARWRHPDGRHLFFQVGLSDERREADALTRALSVPVVRHGKLVLITRDAAFARKVIGHLGGSGSAAATAVEFRLLGALIEAAR